MKKSIIIIIFYVLNLAISYPQSLVVNVKYSENSHNKNNIIKCTFINTFDDTLLTIIEPTLIIGLLENSSIYPSGNNYYFSTPNTLFFYKTNYNFFYSGDGFFEPKYQFFPKMLVIPPHKKRYISIILEDTLNIVATENRCDVIAVINYGFKKDLDSLVSPYINLNSLGYKQSMVSKKRINVKGISLIEFNESNKNNKLDDLQIIINNIIKSVFKFLSWSNYQ